MNTRTRSRIRRFAAAVALSATVAGVASMSPAGAVAADPSQWGQSHRGGVSVEKVNEYEGQHR